MSKLAIKPLILPENVKAELIGSRIEVSGPLGKLSHEIHSDVKISIENNRIFVNRGNDDKKSKSLQGLHYALIRNMIIGVTKGYEKKLEISGFGYQWQQQGRDLVLKVGFSHPVKFTLPEGINAKIDKNILTLHGIDRYLIGETAARLRRMKLPEPYNLSGIKYADERIIKKEGKQAIGAKK